MLDCTQIEALLAVDEDGSFVEAGKTLGMSAIGVARRVEKLEKVECKTSKPQTDSHIKSRSRSLRICKKSHYSR